MAYLLSNSCTKNYSNQTTTGKLSLVIGWYTFLGHYFSVNSEETSSVVIACANNEQETGLSGTYQQQM